jgi:hypothetical protein
MLQGMTGLVGSHTKRGYRCSVIYLRRQAEYSTPWVIMIGKGAPYHFHRYVVKAVGIEQLPGNLGPGISHLTGDPQIPSEGITHLELGIQGKQYGRQQKEQ